MCLRTVCVSYNSVASVDVVDDKVGCNCNQSDNGDYISYSVVGVVLCLPAFVVTLLLFSLLTNILAPFCFKGHC